MSILDLLIFNFWFPAVVLATSIWVAIDASKLNV
jgi:hypothetical protein